ncbi:MAG: ATP-binding protein, partial [Cyclobacteriaceae bacterium]
SVCGGDCDPQILMEAHNALGESYRASNNFVRAELEFKKAIDIAKGISSPRYESMALNSLARIQLDKNDLANALLLVEESQVIVKETNLRDQNLNDYALLTEIYTHLGEYQQASNYQQKYIDLNKQIFNSDLIRNISRIQSAYEERENIKTIAAKDQVLALQEEVIARQKAQYAFIITITFLVLGLAFVMYRANQSQRKTNQALAVAKETIQEQNQMLSNTNQFLESEVEERTRELVDTNESLIKVNDELDNFIYKTSHDIRGPLASLKGICNVAMLDVTDKAALDYLNKLDTSAAKLNAILSRLLIINQINHSILNPEYINFEEQIEEILELERKKDLPARIEITYNIEPEVKFRSDKEMAKIILENLIDNAIKFYNESERVDSFVRIEISKVDEGVLVKVIDNGIGIEEASREKIFQLFVRASERSDSGGIGLYLSKLATLKLGGTIEYGVTEEGFTVFTVHFPPDLVPIIEKRRAEQLKREKQKQKVLKVT